MQTSSPPVITPNRSQSNPDDVITLPRPIQSVGMNLHNVSGTSTGQTLPRERRAPRGTHFCRYGGLLPRHYWVEMVMFLKANYSSIPAYKDIPQIASEDIRNHLPARFDGQDKDLLDAEASIDPLVNNAPPTPSGIYIN